MRATVSGLPGIALLVPVLICLLLQPTAMALAQDTVGELLKSGSSSEPVVLTANEVSYDSQRRLVTAIGNVELSRGARRLLADSLRYEEATDQVYAQGNVVLIESTGDALFGEEMEVTGDLREGFIKGVRALLTDDSRVAGNRATRKQGNITEIDRAVYSPCPLCEDGKGTPLWQIKARRVTHDEAEKMVYFRDAVIEFFGIPVAYTPYLSQPDPTVKRKSGFLAPRFGSDSELGFTVQTPYYYTFAPNRDLTFAPLFTSEGGTVLAVEGRSLETFGRTELRGSLTYTDQYKESDGTPTGQGLRGNLQGRGRYTLDDIHRAGFDLNVVTDDTYLKTYGISNANILKNHAYLQRIEDLDYYALDGWAFQGLREQDDQELIPVALPWAQSRMRSDRWRWGSHWTLDSSLLALTRTGGLDTHRVSSELGWELPWGTNDGQQWRLRLSMRGDAYQTDGKRTETDPDGTTLEDANDALTGRLLPRATLDWSYPLVGPLGEGWLQTVEPLVSVNLAPDGGNDSSIPNEDSIEFEFDETNLMEPIRFTGLDLNEGGPKIAYALRWGAYGPAFWNVGAMFGQSIRFTDDDTFASNSGLDGKVSDYVGRIEIRPADMLDIAYRFRLGKDDLELARNDLTVGLGPPRLRFNFKYLKLSSESSRRDPESQFGRKEMIVGLRYQVLDSLAIAAQTRRDLKEDATITNTYGLVYTHPCLVLVAGLQQDFTERGELDEPVTFTVRLALRNLGQIEAGEGLFGL